MPSRLRTAVGAALLAGVALCGCDSSGPKSFSDAPRELPVHVAGTVAQYAVLDGGAEIAVQGYGLAVNLGTEGSAEVPPHLRKYLTEKLLQEYLGSHRMGTGDIDPSRILADKSTAVVLLAGSIPPGAPVGTRFDVFVSALPQTGTRDLSGGWLLDTDMHMAVEGTAPAGGPSKQWAKTNGSIFVNPFLDPSKPEDAPRLREGRIIGGGVVTRARPVRLVLRQPDYARSNLIQRRINERFPGAKVAQAKNGSIIELDIPREYKSNYEEFLSLLMHLPLHGGQSGDEQRVLRIARELEKPDAPHDSLATVLQAMGRQTLPLIMPLYTSSSPAAAFHAARTGMRLGDDKAADVVIRFAGTQGSAFQVPAALELGRHPRVTRSLPTLRELLDDPNQQVRLAAYEALAKIGDPDAVRRVNIDGRFMLHLVKSRRPDVIYATMSGQPRIVVFGRHAAVRSPVFFTTADNLVTVTDGQKVRTITDKDAADPDFLNKLALSEYGRVPARDRIVRANPGVDFDKPRPGQKVIIPPEKRLLVTRRIPSTGRQSKALYCGFEVSELVRTLGQPAETGPNGRVLGLNMTYGQVVSVLLRMCERGDIPARFVLQTPANIEDAAAAGSGAAQALR